MNIKEWFRRFNFQLLNEIMDKEFGVIECGSISDPENEIYNQPIQPKSCTEKKKEEIEYLVSFY